MRDMTEEDWQSIEAEMDRQDQWLKDHGWMPLDDDGIKWSKNGQELSSGDARHKEIGDLLTGEGWKFIYDYHRIGKLEWNKPIVKWGRYQSPETGRIYHYLDAAAIVEYDLSEEEVYPDKCTGWTQEMNKLFVDPIQTNEIKTWFLHDENGVQTWREWDEKDGKVIVLKEYKVPK